ncbi:toll-like receptor 4 [Mytilus trossulus]|uniref:toll-like receptor 4 n=1 Tax=Mytilus trossulus TaxID=6551 RepID=UPI0030079EB2
MGNNNLSYSLLAAFVLLINLNQAVVHEAKEWKKCYFASSCLCKNISVSEQLIVDCSGKHLLRIPRLPNNIQELSLRSNDISTIQNGIFVGNSLLTTLDLSFNRISLIRNNSFKGLTNLLSLNLSNNDLKYEHESRLRFETLENITTDLQYSAIKNLKVNYIHGIFGMPTILKTSHIWNLKNTSLVRFEAAGNLIQRIEYGALKYLPKSLESADMRDNVFSIGKYMPDLRSLPITSLDISNIRSSHNALTSYIEHCDSRNDTVIIDSENNWLFQQLQYLEMWKSLKYGFPVPRGLKTVSLRSSNLKYEIPNFIFIKNQLENISVSDNVLHTWTGPITNVKRLKFLDLSSNFCSNVSNTFFSPDFVILRYLLLQNNLLGLILPTDVDGEIFQNLRNVVYINLSKNRITKLPNILFKEQHNIER